MSHAHAQAGTRFSSTRGKWLSTAGFSQKKHKDTQDPYSFLSLTCREFIKGLFLRR
jgi:hypothetical protein